MQVPLIIVRRMVLSYRLRVSEYSSVQDFIISSRNGGSCGMKRRSTAFILVLWSVGILGHYCDRNWRRRELRVNRICYTSRIIFYNKLPESGGLWWIRSLFVSIAVLMRDLAYCFCQSILSTYKSVLCCDAIDDSFASIDYTLLDSSILCY